MTNPKEKMGWGTSVKYRLKQLEIANNTQFLAFNSHEIKKIKMNHFRNKKEYLIYEIKAHFESIPKNRTFLYFSITFVEMPDSFPKWSLQSRMKNSILFKTVHNHR